MQQAVEEINGTVKGANETKRVTDDLYKIVELQNRFMTCSGELAQLHKHEFVMETPCRRLSRGKLKKGNLFLFADMLVVAKTKGQKFDAVLIVSAPNLVVTDDVDSSTSPSRSLLSQFVSRCSRPMHHRVQERAGDRHRAQEDRETHCQFQDAGRQGTVGRQARAALWQWRCLDLRAAASAVALAICLSMQLSMSLNPPSLSLPLSLVCSIMKVAPSLVYCIDYLCCLVCSTQ